MKADVFKGFEAIFDQGKLPRKICDWYISKRYGGKKQQVVNLSLCKSFWIVFLFAPLRVLLVGMGLLFDFIGFLLRKTIALPFVMIFSWIGKKKGFETGLEEAVKESRLLGGIIAFEGTALSFLFIGLGIFWINFLSGDLHWKEGNLLSLLEGVGVIFSCMIVLAVVFWVVLAIRAGIRYENSFLELFKSRIKAFKDKVCPLVLKYEFEDKDK